MRIGLIVNPFAGIGGAAGLKGSDGAEIRVQARGLGGKAEAILRARRALERVFSEAPETEVLAGPGPLGEQSLRGLPARHVRILPLPAVTETAEDTRFLAGRMQDVDLLLFAGGDGTARDIAAGYDGTAPMLGIPAGVKMQSAVFAHTPESAADLLTRLARVPRSSWRLQQAEILDIDEEALRAGLIVPRLFDFVHIPVAPEVIQSAKGRRPALARLDLRGAAVEIAQGLSPGVLHLIGPGTSTRLVMEALGLAGSLLGVDAVLDGRLVARDASAPFLEALAENRDVRIVLGVTARQGFLLGRGNQQLSPKLVTRAGREGLIVLADADKLAGLRSPVLWVDTGCPELDARLHGYVRVHTAPGRSLLMRIGRPIRAD